MQYIDCSINPISRQVSYPGAVIVQRDTNVEALRFHYSLQAEHELENDSIRVMVKTAKEIRGFNAENVRIETNDGGDEELVFEHTITRYETEVPGQINVSVCGNQISGDTITEAWHTLNMSFQVGSSVHTDSDEGEDSEETKASNAEKIAALQTLVDAITSGRPIPVDAKSKMTDTSAIYLYTGNETGEQHNYWYYHDGTTWVPGSEYGGITIDDELSSTSENAVQNKVIKAKYDELNGRLGELNTSVTNALLSKVQMVYPTNWYNADAVEDGIIKVDGTYTEDASYLHTDYIPVKPGDILGTFRNGNYNRIYNAKIAVFDSDKNALSDKGRNINTNAAFSIVDGVAYAIVTFRKQDIPSPIRPIITLDGDAPTAYTEYFDPYEVFSEDFLTEESKTALNKLKTNSLSTADLSNAYGCALHKGRIRQTVGLPEKWYNASMVTPKTNYINVSIGTQYQSLDNTGVTFLNTTAFNGVNGYSWAWYDCLLSKRDEYNGSAGYGGERKIVAENLSDCSLLAIGDSTVDQDTMTQCILDHFTEKGHTITLLGTLGSGDNKNEGRAGWKATDYLTNRQYGGVVNPFYNPTTETFDFAYYMTNQQYSAPNFVVIQLGINDIYGTYADVKEQTWAAVKTMIDSIIAYDSTIKIILNLPTTPNSDQSKHSVYEFLYRNRLIRYNEYAIAQAAAYGESKVRCSYCHLILDPDTDIRDNVHPTAEGYRKMALEVVNQINCWQNGY